MRNLFLLLSLIPTLVWADAYWISFSDKKGTLGNLNCPETFLSERTISQRTKYGIEIDSMDLPISYTYADSIKKYSKKIYYALRWFNGVVAEIDAEQKTILERLPFIKEMKLVRYASHRPIKQKQKWIMGNDSNNQQLYGDAYKQSEQINLLPLHNAGFEGQGILMAIVDGGFYNTNTLTAFDSIRPNLLGTYMFADDTLSFFGEKGAHGTEVFSCIAAHTSNFHGTATKAMYYLIYSEEEASESPKEMYNLAASIELADSLGVNVFSTSLGYALFDDSEFDLTHDDLNGKNAICSAAATIAARKGMLFVSSAGNEAGHLWKRICAPADADSIIAVGAVTPTNQHGYFSSLGPSADNRVKPDVSAMGCPAHVISPKNGQVISVNGTSFACPIIAGMAASLWSALPDLDNMSIRQLILESCSLYTTPNDSLGYGIPNAWEAYNQIRTDYKAEPYCAVTSNIQIYNIWGQELNVIPQSGVYILYQNGKGTVHIANKR